MSPKSNDWGLQEKGEGNLGTEETRGRMPCEIEGRDWSDAFTSQGTPRIANSHQQLDGKPGTDSPAESPKEAHPASSWISYFWPPQL